jgi:N-methylhydantoinase A
VLGAAYLAEVTGTGNLITADVGGTSFDVAVIEEGRARVRTEGTIEGYPVKFPHLDIHSIGAGGGSIAWIDRAGGLRVGPHSAGAQPGPICYGRGGRQPTVTDAHAVLGRLETLLGGAMSLDVEAARDGLGVHIGTPLGLTTEQAADGILRVINAAMARAIRVMTVERGIDPRRFTLVAFGGAGPLHAVDLARSLGIPRVLIPIAPGNFSALGLLAAPVREDRVRTCRARDEAADCRRIAAALGALEQEAISSLRDDGFAPAQIRCERSADLRYVGQGYELTVGVPRGDFAEPSWRSIVAAYHGAHERTYGFAKPDDPVELINLRLTAFVDVDRPRWEGHAPAEAGVEPMAERSVWFGGRPHRCPVSQRDRLRAEQRLDGPAVIEEHGATTVMGPRDRATVDRWGNIHVAVASGEGAR